MTMRPFESPGGGLSRRSMIILATGIVASADSTTPGASFAAGRSAQPARFQPSQPRCFVLVHGAWHGGWCWKPLAQRLRNLGHLVYAPTLTGLAERSHLARDETDLSTHVKDVAELLRYEDLQDVTLVGHSYSGLVISGVAAEATGRLSNLIYLDAFVPEDGQSFAELAQIGDLKARVKDGLVAPMLSAEQLGLRDPAVRGWASERIGGHPWRCFAEPLRVSVETLSVLPRSYIQTSDLLPQEAAEATTAGFEMFDARPAGHDAMLTDPNRLADLLLAAEGVRTGENPR